MSATGEPAFDPATTRPMGQSAQGPEKSATAAGGEPTPARLGRYRVTGRLGSGYFGVVYQGFDDELQRPVAIKVPHRRHVVSPQDVERYLTEARTLSGLHHPHIVPVYDVGRTDDGLCFVVSRFVEGGDLAGKLRQGRPSFAESAGLVAAVAEALQYAHQQGIVHRDVKPANILVVAGGQPFLADFGLALREEDFGTGAALAGTPAYMSPEQANGESHRVDGRSDIFSLGVVLYELLTGRLPFVASGRRELLAHIATAEVRPPRQLDPAIPRELERICLKALARRAADRYTTAFDLADDLRHWQSQMVSPTATEPAATSPPPCRIVPKGLRAFDAHDADFFLELLPGPRDRDGLPEALRFWKLRVEERDGDQTFRVGLLYGPSGCGKSSLVKAGLLPRLAPHVVAVYVEATADGTEARLLQALRKRCPGLPPTAPLTEALATLRRGSGLPAGQKVLLVLDQFEQWLHARPADGDADLLRALRQCDGERVQCLVLVRDDFWLAVSRFMKELEVPVVEKQNAALVDLFDPLHARRVLTDFGRSFGRLPDPPAELSRDPQEFLEQAVAGLAQDGKVIPVRLALCAEMMKGKPWTPATLKAVGGVRGVGVAFLEDTFSAASAPPHHRLHQKAARAVLRALLPEQGTDIRGRMRSREQLLEASGYAGRPGEFAELLRILDGELRLLTPADPEPRGYKRLRLSADPATQPTSEAACGYGASRYYQLTHDYLVPALREWLTRKQK
jgi:hypothetical protein